MTKLKPCPFCGGEVSYVRMAERTSEGIYGENTFYTDAILCNYLHNNFKGCPASMFKHRYKYDGKKFTEEEYEKNANELIELWNRRTGQ